MSLTTMHQDTLTNRTGQEGAERTGKKVTLLNASAETHYADYARKNRV